MSIRVCPACSQEFCKAKVEMKVRYCPYCETAIHYQKRETILLEDKLAVDRALHMFNDMIGVELLEATARERRFLYDLLGWLKGWVSDRTLDIGKSVHEFFVAFFEWVIDDSYWKPIFKSSRSVIVISNSKSRLVERYYKLLEEEVTYFDDPDGYLAEKLRSLRNDIMGMMAGSNA